MGIPDLVLQRYLSTDGISRLLWNHIRGLLVRTFNDPACSITAHGHSLRLPLSHELPMYLQLLPMYDRLPERLSTYLHDKFGSLKCLDVGANIGATVAALYQGPNDLFLAIEPDPKFNHYLHKNWNNPNVKILDQVCASNTGRERFRLVERFGTATFYEDSHGMEFQTTTVDDLLAEYPEFADLHFLKIDTDGSDFAVLCGAKQALLHQPAVLFECDVFGNKHYVQDCMEALTLFSAAGYRSLLVYEKFGYPLGRYELGDLAHFKELLFYQLTKKYIYFDILLMKEQDLLAFYELEKSFFSHRLQSQSLM